MMALLNAGPHRAILEREKLDTRVLMSGDYPLTRSALALLLSHGGLTVAGECCNQPDALRRAIASGMDLVVMDLDLDATRITRMEKLVQLLNAASGCPVLIVTRSEDPHTIVTALRKGAAGVVRASNPPDVFLRAARAVLAGGAWFERSTVASVFRSMPAREPSIGERLTPREMQIVELVSQGLQNKKIAERLSITDTTVRHHLTSIFEKLSVTNRMELMRYTYGDVAISETVNRN